MRILYVTLFFPPYRYSGTEVYTLNLAKGFQALGHEVEILCAEDWNHGPAYWNGVTSDYYQGILVHRIHLNWNKAKNPNKILYDSRHVLRYLDKYLKQNKFDLIHVTSAITLSVGVLKVVHELGLPLVLTLTDFWFLCPSLHLLRRGDELCDGFTTPFECEDCLLQQSRLYQRIANTLPKTPRQLIISTLAHLPTVNKLRGFRGMLLNMQERKKSVTKALELPDVILSPSSFLMHTFQRHNVERLRLLHHGHDLHWLETFQGKTQSNKFRFGFIGQIQHVKGIHLLLEALIFADLGDRVTLSIWGDLSQNPEYVEELQQLIHNEQSVAFYGKYEHEQLSQVLAGIDVVVVPSIWYENSPLVIQEAFASKTPVIATNIGGMSEAVQHEVNGLLFERLDVKDLARQLRRFVDEPDLLPKLQAGIPKVRLVSDEISELGKLYGDVISSKKIGTQV